MDKLVDYVKWIGDLSFDAYPFREADALILCVISYFDLKPVFDRICSPPITDEAEKARVLSQGYREVYVRDCIPMLEAGEAKLEITGGDMGNTEIFEAAARSRRFGDLLMDGYESVLRSEPEPLQFAAVTFRCLNRFSFIAYRGTDASLAGWEEDFMIAFTRTEAQEMAREYAERMLADPTPAFGPDWYLAGHSKGGNQALYAACTVSDEAWSKVTRAYLLDGPGFCPEVMDLSLIDRIDPKSTRIIPEFDVIGKLFEPKITDTKIVYSYRDGIEQHSLASWLVDHGALALAPQNDPKAKWLNDTLDKWIGSISQENRPIFIGELFDALGAGGITSLDELSLDAFEAALSSLREKSEVTKQTLQDLPKSVTQNVLDKVMEKPEQNEIKEAREAAEKTTVITWLKNSPFAHALVLIAGGIGLLLANKSIVEISSFAFLFSLTALWCGLTLRRLYKNHWSLDGMRERIIISLIGIGLLICLVVKEQALFLFGSVIFGVLCFIVSYEAGEKAVEYKEHRFLRILHILECVITAIYGVSFLVIPSATVAAYAISIGIFMLADGLVRLIRAVVLQRRNTRLLEKV